MLRLYVPIDYMLKIKGEINYRAFLKDIVDAVIGMHNIPIHMTGFCENWQALSQMETNNADALLLSDDGFERLKEIKDVLKSSSIKIVLLWD